MKEHALSTQVFLILLLGLAILNGCNSNAANATKIVQEAAPVTIRSSQTPSPTLTEIGTGNRSARTPPPAPSGLPPTWTPLPTYSPEQARQIVMKLYENNVCKLPCWWGIEPGKTDWREAWQFLGRFAANQPPWDNLLLESKTFPGYMYYRVLLNVPNTTDEYYYLSLNDLWFVINIHTFDVDYIDVNTGNTEAYTIPEILSNYGKPEKIYAEVLNGPISQLSGVSLLLYYPNHGFVSNHFTTVDQEQLKEPKFTACFQKVTNLYLWPVKQQMDFITRLKISQVDATTISLLRPIDQVSNLNVDSFYNAFANTKGEPCINFVATK